MRRAAQKTKRTLAVVTLALAGCRGPIQAVTPTPEIIPLRLVASSSTAPLLRSLTAHYQPDNALVTFVDQDELGLTLQQVLAPSRNTPAEAPAPPPAYALTTYLDPDHDLWAAPLGQDAIAIITHPDLNLDKLTAAELRDIFSGAVTRWSSIDGPRDEIVVVSQPASADTHQHFQEMVLGQRQITFAARLAPTPQAMLDIVATTPGAIGYVSLAWVDAQVDVVPVAATADSPALPPTRETIADQTYPLRMPILIAGTAPPTPGDGYYEFVLWAQSSGQAIISADYVPLAAIR